MGKTEQLVKLVRLSDKTFEKIQRAQMVRETYGQVVDEAIDLLLEKRKKKERT
jgi:hypothetical protein